MLPAQFNSSLAPSLNAHRSKAWLWLSHEPELTTAHFLDYLNTHNLVSNVELEEVECVAWDHLKGI